MSCIAYDRADNSTIGLTLPNLSWLQGPHASPPQAIYERVGSGSYLHGYLEGGFA
jgi:hypothetical protein